MYELKEIGKAFTSEFVGNGPSSYKKRIYRAAVSQRLRNTALSGAYAFFWDVTSCTLEGSYQRIGTTCWLHFLS
jgi:hypothetical protein